MAAIIIQVPEKLQDLAGPIVALLRSCTESLASNEDEGAVDFAEVQRRLAAQCASVECAANRAVLQSYEVCAPAVTVDGVVHRRVGRYPGPYYTMAGEVEVERCLYRPAGQRNAPTVDAISLRTGAQDGWHPETQSAVAWLLAQGTSREAVLTAERLSRLPYSRCSFERVGHRVGRRCVERQDAIYEALAESNDELARRVSTVSVSLDRASIPVEEPVGREPSACIRAFRMAFCGTVTLHASDGAAMRTFRYAEMAGCDHHEMFKRMRRDIAPVLASQPRARLVCVADGAHELWNHFRLHFRQDQFPGWRGKRHHIVDFWHLVEKLAAAAEVLQDSLRARENLLSRWKAYLVNCPRAVGKILRELRRSGCEDKRRNNTCPVADAIRYMENHRHRMRYARARRAGLPIGSGQVEATCKSLIALRMKRPGARWKVDGAQDVLQLRAHALSDRWEAAMKATLDKPKTVRVLRAA